MKREEIGRIAVGALYDYAGGRGRYEVVALAWDPVHLREVVVYRGLAGADRGRQFVCSPADFVQKFRPAEG
jgi:hypothetical protein